MKRISKRDGLADKSTPMGRGSEEMIYLGSSYQDLVVLRNMKNHPSRKIWWTISPSEEQENQIMPIRNISVHIPQNQSNSNSPQTDKEIYIIYIYWNLPPVQYTMMLTVHVMSTFRPFIGFNIAGINSILVTLYIRVIAPLLPHQ